MAATITREYHDGDTVYAEHSQDEPAIHDLENAGDTRSGSSPSSSSTEPSRPLIRVMRRSSEPGSGTYYSGGVVFSSPAFPDRDRRGAARDADKTPGTG
jgi:hypothetical protein